MPDQKIKLNLGKLKSRDFYRLLNFKPHQSTPVGLQCKRKTVPADSASGMESFKMSYKIRKENKLREFR